MSSVAKRYAKALFALGVEDGTESFEAIGAELARISGTMANEEIARVASDPTLDPKSRQSIAGHLSEALGLSRTLENFLAVVAENNRLGALRAIETDYRVLVDRRLGRVRARIRSASPLDQEGVRQITDAFARKTGKAVLAHVLVEPELLGGVAVEIEGRVYDGTLRSELERLRASLAGA